MGPSAKKPVSNLRIKVEAGHPAWLSYDDHLYL